MTMHENCQSHLEMRSESLERCHDLRGPKAEALTLSQTLALFHFPTRVEKPQNALIK